MGFEDDPEEKHAYFSTCFPEAYAILNQEVTVMAQDFPQK